MISQRLLLSKVFGRFYHLTMLARAIFGKKKCIVTYGHILNSIFLFYFVGTVNFNHRQGCQKCEVEGVFQQRMSYPNLNSILRTDRSFRERKKPLHHKQRSRLEDLPVNMIEDFPIADSLHLLDHGVMKKSLQIWINGGTSHNSKFSKNVILELDKIIHQANKQMPSDVHRSLRGLSYINYWKGTEFRVFLLYVGIVVLKEYLPTEAYDNFLLFFCAVRICSSEKYVNIQSISNELFRDYVNNFGLIYGSNHIVSNIHNLIHVYNDVKRLGNLNTITTYKFENCLRQLKLRVQARDAPLEQIARRIIESAQNYKVTANNLNSKKFEPYLKHFFKPNSPTNFIAYKHVQISSNVFLSVKKMGDSFFLTKDKQIVQMNFAFRFKDNFFIDGSPILFKEDFFSDPFSSRFIDIYKSCGRKGISSYFSINRVECKLLRLSYNNDFVFMPILHSLDELMK